MHAQQILEAVVNEYEILETVINEYQAELYRVHQILMEWDTPQSRELAKSISASLPFRGEKAIQSRLIELEKENLRLRSLLNSRQPNH